MHKIYLFAERTARREMHLYLELLLFCSRVKFLSAKSSRADVKCISVLSIRWVCEGSCDFFWIRYFWVISGGFLKPKFKFWLKLKIAKFHIFSCGLLLRAIKIDRSKNPAPSTPPLPPFYIASLITTISG